MIATRKVWERSKAVFPSRSDHNPILGTLACWSMLLAGQGCMLAPSSVIQGIGAIVMLAALLISIGVASPPAGIRAGRVTGRTIVWASAGIGLLSLIFRTAYLLEAPPGLYVDEVYTARNAFLWRLSGSQRLFEALPLIRAGSVETSNLYLAYVSTVMAVFGDDPLGIRMASVLPSLVAVAAGGGLAACLAGASAGLWTALFLAASHWAVRTGRTGWDQVMMTALQYGSLLAMLLSLRLKTRWAAAGLAAIAGSLMGLCLYTYVASRLAALHLALWGLWEMTVAIRGSASWRRAIADDAWRWALAMAVALLVISPYAHYMATRSPSGSEVRTQELWLFRDGLSGGLFELARNIPAHLMMFHGRGGTYARDNTPDSPMLDPITGFAFTLGLAWAARAGTTGCHAQQAGARLLLSLFPIVVLGGVLSSSGEGAPYVYRVANLAPWACILAGLGMSDIQGRLAGGLVAWPDRNRRWALAAAAFAMVVVNACILSYGYGRMPDFVTAFGTLEHRLGRFLEQQPGVRPVLVDWNACQSVPRLRSDNRHPEINGYNFFLRPDASIAGIHLSAGLYRQHPELARNPLTAKSPVIMIGTIPAVLPVGHGYLVTIPDARPGLEGGFHARFIHRIHDHLGRPLCDIFEVTARSASASQPAS